MVIKLLMVFLQKFTKILKSIFFKNTLEKKSHSQFLQKEKSDIVKLEAVFISNVGEMVFKNKVLKKMYFRQSCTRRQSESIRNV